MTDGAATERTDARIEPEEWIERFAAALGVDAPDAATVQTLLELAGVAAHASERVAAPIACYLVGRAGIGAEAGLELGTSIATTS